MMFSSAIPFVWAYIVFFCATSRALLVPRQQSNLTSVAKVSFRHDIVQQNLAIAPPIPILEIGYRHIISMMGANATKAENQSIAQDTSRHPLSSRFLPLWERATPAECSVSNPCVDGSCCNSEGKCGFTPYNCQTTATTTCISNCNAHANCGVDSLNSDQTCPLNLCCSYLGYCGLTDLYCADKQPLPCQKGFGSCQVVPTPSCPHGRSSTKGRRVAYYQSHNVRDRACDQIYPSQIDTTGLTHLNFAFLFIDPVSFRVVPVDPGDTSLYSQFTALKSTVMQTWISVGGSALSDLGPTQFTWSDMASTAANRAAFITSLCTFLEQYGFQGVDLDWETPTVSSRGGRPADLNNLVLLLKDMRTEFGTRYGISIALPPDYYDLSGFDAKALQPYLDFFNFMAYDIHGPWETPYLGAFVRPQASIVDIGTDTSPLWFDGVDPSKVNLGIPYYGRGYTLTNLTCTDVGCPYSGPNYAGQCSGSPGVLSLKEIDEIIEQRKLVPKKIPNAFQKQITFDNQWIGYDDKDTIHEKVRWGDEHCLGGTVVWSIDLAAGNGKPAPSAPLTIPVIPSPSVTPPEGPLKASIDGSCGQSATCLGSLFGDCCSKYGYCGHTSDYCSLDSGCQSYFGLCGDTPLVSPVAPVASPVSTSNPITALKPSVDGSCGKDATCLGSTFGPCCSSYGWCGSTSEYCLPSNGCQAGFGACTGSLATTASPSSSSSPTTISPVLSLTAPLKVSIDGSCGHGYTCLGSAFGNCCSVNGYCGSASAYCSLNDGCQMSFGICGSVSSSPVTTTLIIPPPAAQSSGSILQISEDGSCGNGITCSGSKFGNCCSSSGYCGSSPAYCGSDSGCQKEFGTCPLNLIIRVTGSCGDGVSCQGSTFGDCCSQHGYCGSSEDYCASANGCQAGFGTCQ